MYTQLPYSVILLSTSFLTGFINYYVSLTVCPKEWHSIFCLCGSLLLTDFFTYCIRFCPASGANLFPKGNPLKKRGLFYCMISISVKQRHHKTNIMLLSGSPIRLLSLWGLAQSLLGWLFINQSNSVG